MVTVRERFASAKLDSVMEELEQSHGIDNPISKISVLEKLCSFTKAGDAVLNDALLTWVIHDLMAATRNRCLSGAEKTRAFHRIKCSLLSRRICYYVISKLRFTKSEAKKCVGDMGSATDVKSPLGFYNNFLSHEALEKSMLNDTISDKLWLSNLPEYQRESLETMRLFLDPSPALYAALDKSIDKDPQASAEECLVQDHWQSNLPALAPISSAPPPAPEPAAVAAETEIPADAGEPEHDDDALHSGQLVAQMTAPSEALPAGPSHEDALRSITDVLSIPSWLMDIMRKVSPEVISLSVDSYVRFLKTKSEKMTSFEETVGDALQGQGPWMILLDGMNFGSPSPKCSGVPGHLLRAAVSKVMELDADNEIRALGGDSLFMISDGRNGQCDRLIRSEIKKKAKAAQNVCTRKACVNFRLMFHLRELSASGHLGLRSKKKMHSQLGKPLENLRIVKGKQTIMPVKERKFLDLPGDSSTRGLSNLPLVYLESTLTSYCFDQ
ncbi:unnamed protein product [Symbiodinium sp. CCMP2456]|nr:unnamed protein product [Symbiodinium sp. CCMP2456]